MKQAIFMALILTDVAVAGCAEPTHATGPTNGSVTKADADVQVNPDGLTTEQRNVKHRVEEDNTPGAIKHLYVISAYSGQVLMYSTVDGKVTSSGKRLDSLEKPYCVSNGDYGKNCMAVERMQDDGTYGSSVEYLFWFDINGNYQQVYPAGGFIIHISSEPLVYKDVLINVNIVGS